MLLIALTGGIGSGKSTASALLVERGAILIDADAVNRELQAAGGKAFQPMVDLFGRGVVGPDGELDRRAIAAVAFNDAEARQRLNALMHPMIGAEIVERVKAQAPTDNVVVLDIVLLATSNPYGVEAVIVVDCPVDMAVDRLVTQRGMDRADAEARVAAQISRQQRLALADFVIDNSGAPDDLALAVDKCWAWLATLRNRSPKA